RPALELQLGPAAPKRVRASARIVEFPGTPQRRRLDVLDGSSLRGRKAATATGPDHAGVGPSMRSVPGRRPLRLTRSDQPAPAGLAVQPAVAVGGQLPPREPRIRLARLGRLAFDARAVTACGVVHRVCAPLGASGSVAR